MFFVFFCCCLFFGGGGGGGVKYHLDVNRHKTLTN